MQSHLQAYDPTTGAHIGKLNSSIAGLKIAILQNTTNSNETLLRRSTISTLDNTIAFV